ncbi:hypothetical protein, partial [Raoultella sp. 18117]|uniref:hypothetical protein n=1 Tax=Raoultella sp. 18117 TaxID=2681449 RepID=UPI001D1158A0
PGNVPYQIAWRCFFPVALTLTGLRVCSRLWIGSPDKARQAPPPGNVPYQIAWRCFFPVALTLTGLRVCSRLWIGSPDKARQAPPPGLSSEIKPGLIAPRDIGELSIQDFRQVAGRQLDIQPASAA